MRRFETPSSASRSIGGEPRTGSIAQTRNTRGKKGGRPVKPIGRAASGVGARLRGRSLVESLCPAKFACLDPKWSAAVARVGQREDRHRGESPRLLWAAAPRYQ